MDAIARRARSSHTVPLVAAVGFFSAKKYSVYAELREGNLPHKERFGEFMLRKHAITAGFSTSDDRFKENLFDNQCKNQHRWIVFVVAETSFLP